MADIQGFTTHRNYPLPNPANVMRNDVQRIASGITAIDADMLDALRLATDEAVGRVRFATSAETMAGTVADAVVTPITLTNTLTAWTASNADATAGTDTKKFVTSAAGKAALDARFANVLEATTGVSTSHIVSPFTMKAAIDASVTASVNGILGGAGAALDTLKELATAMGNDPNFANTVATEIGTKLSKSGGAISGALSVSGLLTLNGGLSFSVGGASFALGGQLYDDGAFPDAAGRTLLLAAGDRFYVANKLNNVAILQAYADGTFKYKGQDIFHTGNLSPGLYLPRSGGSNGSAGQMTGVLAAFLQNQGGIGTATGGLGSIEVVSNGAAGHAAFMTFHRSGSHAAYFGLDTDNKWKVGGWSMGANAYAIFHEGNRDATKAGLASANYFTNSVNSFNSSIYVDGDSNRHLWFRTAGGVNRGLVYHDQNNASIYLQLYNASGAAQRSLRLHETGDMTWIGRIVASGSDILTHRNNTTGFIYFGNASNGLFGTDGSNFLMNGPGELYINGARNWASNNFNPATKADLNAYASFTGIGLNTGGSQAYVYSDSAAHNVVFRTGVNPNFKYSGIDAAGFLTTAGGFRAYGVGFIWGDRLTIGEGAAGNTWIEMRDADEGVKYLHNNGGSIGFVNTAGAWIFRAYEGGSIWCGQLGDINTRIEDRAAAWAAGRVSRNGDDIPGNLQITRNYPQFMFHYPNVRIVGWQLREDGNLWLYDQSAGNHPHSFRPGGVYWNSQIGDLNTRIEDRASAYASGRVAKSGDTMTGDLSISKGYPGIELVNTDGNGFAYIDFRHNPYGHGDFTYRIRHNSGDNSLYMQYVDGGTQFALRTNGALHLGQFGDLHNRIEDRAFAWAESKKGEAVAHTNNSNFRQNSQLPYLYDMGLEGGNRENFYVNSTGGYLNLITTTDRQVLRMNYHPSGYFEVNTRNYGGFGIYYFASDYNIKESIVATEMDSFSLLMSVPFKDFNYRQMSGKNSDARVYAGVIAQDLQNIEPSWVMEVTDGPLHLDIQNMVTSTMHAVQQLGGYFADAEYKINRLTARLAAVEAQLAA